LPPQPPKEPKIVKDKPEPPAATTHSATAS
jgi:hypothetical protein